MIGQRGPALRIISEGQLSSLHSLQHVVVPLIFHTPGLAACECLYTSFSYLLASLTVPTGAFTSHLPLRETQSPPLRAGVTQALHLRHLHCFDGLFETTGIALTRMNTDDVRIYQHDLRISMHDLDYHRVP